MQGGRDLLIHTGMRTISVKVAGAKGKKPYNVDLRISMKILFHYSCVLLSISPMILKAFPNTFPTKMKPSKCKAKRKSGVKKQKKREGEKAKDESRTATVSL